jgi:hypothetical protein
MLDPVINSFPGIIYPLGELNRFCYGVGGTRGAAQRLARDFFPPPAGGNITPCI